MENSKIINILRTQCPKVLYHIYRAVHVMGVYNRYSKGIDGVPNSTLFFEHFSHVFKHLYSWTILSVPVVRAYEALLWWGMVMYYTFPGLCHVSFIVPVIPNMNLSPMAQHHGNRTLYINEYTEYTKAPCYIGRIHIELDCGAVVCLFHRQVLPFIARNVWCTLDQPTARC